jgi:stage V sporulation protein G
MEITEVRVKLTSNQSDRVRAFCSVTFDREFVVRDIKVIEGTSGLFVAMPSRKISDHCPKCRGKNHLRAKHCNECGTKLRENRAPRNGAGRSKLHADIAHPINMSCRERLQDAILEEDEAEVGRASEPGYSPPDLDVAEDRAEPAPSEDATTGDRDKGKDTREEADEFDNGAEYAALIAELKTDRPKRGETSDHPAADNDESEEQGSPEPAEAKAQSESEVESDSEFGKGIL